MIALFAIGIGFLLVLAVVIGIIDAAQASGWRRTASERRRRWEARQPQYLGPEPWYDDYDDD